MTDVPTPESPEPQDPRKGPLSFLSGALTAGLLAWLAQRSEPLPEQGPLGPELPPPADPVQGHPGDLPVK